MELGKLAMRLSIHPAKNANITPKVRAQCRGSLAEHLRWGRNIAYPILTISLRVLYESPPGDSFSPAEAPRQNWWKGLMVVVAGVCRGGGRREEQDQEEVMGRVKRRHIRTFIYRRLYHLSAY